jgi:uroporphyrinogen-III synthase
VRLLLTRPEPQAQRTAATLRSKHHDVIIAPLLRIEADTEASIGTGPWAAVLVTSANAAQAIAGHPEIAHLRRMPAFAVGQRSAQAMIAAGFADVNSADGGVKDLARFVAGRVPPGAGLIYLAGEDRAGDLAGELHAHGFSVHTAIVYRAVATTALPPAAMQALAAHLDGVLHFSRRTAETYVSLARDADMLARALKPAHFCLSAAVAEPLVRAGAAVIQVAPQPAEAALIELVGAA